MPRQPKTSTTKTVTVTLPMELDEQIREIAKAESRSFSNTFAMLLTRMLAIRALDSVAANEKEPI